MQAGLLLLTAIVTSCSARADKSGPEVLTATQRSRFERMALQAGLSSVAEIDARRHRDGILMVTVTSNEVVEESCALYKEAYINKPYGLGLWSKVIQRLSPMEVVNVVERADTIVPVSDGVMRVMNHEGISIKVAQALGKALWERDFAFRPHLPIRDRDEVLTALATLTDRKISLIEMNDDLFTVYLDHHFVCPSLRKAHGRWFVESIGFGTD